MLVSALGYQFGHWCASLLDANNVRILQEFPHLSTPDLAKAWASAEAHPEEIETALARNAEA
ncbi:MULTISPECIES: hypothetical protein [unclassified Microcoleus]|uniref:hypothetical protein n=1 Tax=unclassified Microcoleus TaxID=2642155 RepID=UPI002FD3BFB5